MCLIFTPRFLDLMGKPRDLVESLDPDAPLRPVGVRGGGVLGAEDAVSLLLMTMLNGETVLTLHLK